MEKESREHVLILPFMAQGHIIPFLALAIQIEKRYKYQITFINTPLNIKKLRSLLPPTSGIRLRSIPYDSAGHGLPPNTENTDALPYNLIFRLMQSSFALESHLRKLLEEIVQEDDKSKPLCIITDMFFAWVGAVSHDLGIAHAIFAATSAFGMACYYSLWSNVPNWKVEGFEEFVMEDFPEGGTVHVTQMPSSMAAADGNDAWSVFQRKMLGGWYNADAALFNSVEEIDRVGLGYFRRKIRIPVWAIGPIVNQNQRGKTDDGTCRAWLDSKPPRSVVYICFGSQNTLTAAQMVEMASALEASGRFFIWVVRPPLGKEFEAEFKVEQWLPSGFEKRIEGRGLLVSKWAPQVEILSHGSTGAFISHCGWNSTLEAMANGVPILSWPMAGEQFFNVKLLEGELGICAELGRGNGCEVGREEIVRKIEMVMGEDGGAMEVRRAALEVKEMLAQAKKDEGGRRGSSVRALDEFFLTLVAQRERRTVQFSS